MPESTPIQLETVEGSLVSQDGRHLLIKCRTALGDETEIVIPTPALDNLIANLKLLSMSAQIVSRTSAPIQIPTVQFGEPEPTFIVTALGGVVFGETGMVQLRVGEMHGRVFQMSMRKEQSQVLYDLLLELFATDDEKPS